MKQIFIGISILFLGLSASFIIGDYVYWRGRYPPNCYFENINVSGLKRSKAMHKLALANADEATRGYITILLEGKKYKFLPSEIGITIDHRGSIRKTTLVAYQHSFIRSLMQRLPSMQGTAVLPLSLKVDKKAYLSFLKRVAKQTDVASKDAGVIFLSGGRHKIIKEVVGKELDVNASLKDLQKALNKDQRTATIEVDAHDPRVYAKDLKPSPPVQRLSKFSTFYGVHNSANRIHNIKHTSAKINDYILLSGEVYSLVKIVGDINLSSGFKKAFVVIGNSLDPQAGGGACQVSTTLYNAAILAGLDIVERHPHGLYFNIYPLGRDAAIYGRVKDLRFKNNTGHPLLIRAAASDSSCTIKIYGTPVPGKRVYFTSPTVYIEGKRPSTDSPKQTMQRIREILDKNKKKPFVSVVRMITYQDNRVVDKRVIKSRYRFAAFHDNVDITEPEPE
ncbi:VanW family protein [Candidatus Margulisiibacteriota bacterium]